MVKVPDTLPPSIHDLDFSWRRGADTGDPNDVIGIDVYFTVYWRGPDHPGRLHQDGRDLRHHPSALDDEPGSHDERPPSGLPSGLPWDFA